MRAEVSAEIRMEELGRMFDEVVRARWPSARRRSDPSIPGEVALFSQQAGEVVEACRGVHLALIDEGTYFFSRRFSAYESDMRSFAA